MKKWLPWLLLLLSLPVAAQRIRTVHGTSTYYAEANESLAAAKQKALEGARMEALARTFGTILSQSNVQTETSRNGRESTYFSSLTETEVKGEWLEDTGAPEYEVTLTGDLLIVTCKVSGKARAISNEAAEFEATVLRNGTEERFADTHFREGDDLYLLFHAPTDGFVAVYLVDEEQNAFCLLPYLHDTDGQQEVSHGQPYVFFSKRHGPADADEYTLTCHDVMERNRLYIIFSPKPFTKAVDNRISRDLPRQLDYDAFRKWLGALRKRDTALGVKEIQIEISK